MPLNPQQKNLKYQVDKPLKDIMIGESSLSDRGLGAVEELLTNQEGLKGVDLGFTVMRPMTDQFTIACRADIAYGYLSCLHDLGIITEDQFKTMQQRTDKQAFDARTAIGQEIKFLASSLRPR